jgi:hypothetical protein
MPPILAGLLSYDQRNGVARRLLAGAGLLAALLALTLVAEPNGLGLLVVAAVLLTGAAIHGADGPKLRQFLVINGAAMLLLAWAVTETADLTIERSPEQLDVTVNGVRLTANLAGIDSPLNRVTVEMGALDQRPVAAAWMFGSLPWFEGFGDWLMGGMRSGVASLRVIDGTNTDLVPTIDGLWQPRHAGAPPRLSGSAPVWITGQSADGDITLTSPEIFTTTYQVVARTVRPSGPVRVTLGGEEPGTVLDVVAAPDRRHFEVSVRQQDGTTETLVGGPYVYRRSVAGWVQAIWRELGRAWLVALALVAAARFLSIPLALTMPPVRGLVGGVLMALAAVAVGAATLAATGVIALFLLGGIPHTVESIAYLFQAEILARGGLWVPAPVLPEFFQQAYVATTPDGRWFGVLPPGQSLLLAGGLLVGAPWLVGPVASALAVAVTIVVGRLAYGAPAGVVAGLLLLCSPFVLLLSGDMLAHPAGLLLSMLMVLAAVIALRGSHILGWPLAGVAMGGLVLTRPLAAVGIGVPLLLTLVFASRGVRLKLLVLRAALFVLAAAPGVVYAGYSNEVLTGSVSIPPLSLWSDVDRMGFGATVGTRGGHDFASALGNTWANVTVLSRHLFGWPSYLTLALACVPFVLGTRSRWDGLLLICVGGMVAAHWVYWSDGIIYGPRFLFETVGALALLTARGALLLARGNGLVPDDGDIVALLADAVDVPVVVPLPQAVSIPAMTSAPLVVTLVAALIAVNLVGYLPDMLLAYRNYNGINRQNLAVVEEAGLQHAVVFVTSDWPNWQAYGSVFAANGPFLDRPIIYARDLGESENWRLLTRYTERRGLILRDGKLIEVRP